MRKLAFTWYGHSTFVIITPGGKRIVTDPWLEHNPMCPPGMKKITEADVVEALSLPEAIPALEAGLALEAAGAARQPVRPLSQGDGLPTRFRVGCFRRGSGTVPGGVAGRR